MNEDCIRVRYQVDAGVATITLQRPEAMNAFNCDLMLMAEEAYLYAAFAPIGLVPDGGATWHLVRAMGYKRAYQTIIEGSKIPAAECLALGLANQVIKSEGFLATVLAYAKGLAERAPLALRYSKQLARSAMCATLETCILDEAALQNITITSRDAREAVQAFFQKRPPARDHRLMA